jgi:hypothetical protein
VYTRLFSADTTPATPPPVNSPVAMPVAVTTPDAGPARDAGSVAVADLTSSSGGTAVSAPVGTLRVVEAEGPLEKRSAGGNESWTQLKQGETLQVLDSVRTGRDGKAVLEVGDGARVALAGRTEVQVKANEGAQARVKLMEGRISADVKEGGGGLGVETHGSDAVADTRSGRFSMMSDGRGQVAVATETGQVRLRAHGQEVAVPKGTLSTVAPGEGPTQPVAVPRSLLLKVAAPEHKVQKAPEHDVEGTASPGALVRVKDRSVRVDEQGHFKIRVPLKEGKNVVEVAAVDVMGREKLQSYTIQVDTKAPKMKGVMKWGGQ